MSTAAKRRRILASLLVALALSACATAIPRVGAAARLADAAARVADRVAAVSPMGPVCREATRRVAAVGIVAFFRPAVADGSALDAAAEIYGSMGCPASAMAAITFGAADEARALSLGSRFVDG